jgi:peroxiredoxin family protein
LSITNPLRISRPKVRAANANPFYLCGTAGKIWGSDKLEDYVDIVDTVCGIGEYIAAAQEADLSVTL